MKLSDWAKSQGISYKTAWRLWKSGNLPVPAEQLSTGTVIVHSEAKSDHGVALYARVSGSDQKTDLDRQLLRLSEYAIAHKLFVIDSVKEVGSGLNGHRKGLDRLLKNPKIRTIIVEHKDRLMRFGFEYVEAALMAQDRRLLIIEQEEITDDIVQDLHDVIVSMCARLYGKRSAAHRASKAMSVIHEHTEKASK